ncbi:uncharacterized protein LOC111148752 [Enhydra lutris kenyoni]|uniref:Uncharacterized protein LOC111148752 n=1 Tax=Enhydra lutris kenyoni TaxID=391180 RepID=A0A2Y9JNX2_ENHLU|nr:uncharacterized protein LOC111148752 [Enhydra lutris kenyoni]
MPEEGPWVDPFSLQIPCPHLRGSHSRPPPPPRLPWLSPRRATGASPANVRAHHSQTHCPHASCPGAQAGPCEASGSTAPSLSSNIQLVIRPDGHQLPTRASARLRWTPASPLPGGSGASACRSASLSSAVTALVHTPPGVPFLRVSGRPVTPPSATSAWSPKTGSRPPGCSLWPSARRPGVALPPPISGSCPKTAARSSREARLVSGGSSTPASFGDFRSVVEEVKERMHEFSRRGTSGPCSGTRQRHGAVTARGGEEARGHHPGLATDNGETEAAVGTVGHSPPARLRERDVAGVRTPRVRVRRARGSRRPVSLAVKVKHTRERPTQAPAPASRRRPRSPVRVRLPDATDRGGRRSARAGCGGEAASSAFLQRALRGVRLGPPLWAERNTAREVPRGSPQEAAPHLRGRPSAAGRCVEGAQSARPPAPGKYSFRVELVPDPQNGSMSAPLHAGPLRHASPRARSDWLAGGRAGWSGWSACKPRGRELALPVAPAAGVWWRCALSPRAG